MNIVTPAPALEIGTQATHHVSEAAQECIPKHQVTYSAEPRNLLKKGGPQGPPFFMLAYANPLTQAKAAQASCAFTQES